MLRPRTTLALRPASGDALPPGSGRRSFRRELFAAFFLSTGIAVLLLGALRIYLFLDATAQSRRTRLTETAQSVARLIEAFLGEKERLLLDLAAHVEATGDDRAAVARRLAALRSQDTSFVRFLVRWPSGELLADGALGGHVPAGATDATAAARSAAAQTGRHQISLAYADEALGSGPFVTLVAPWRRATEEPAGTVEGVLDLSRLGAITVALSRLPESQTWVVDGARRLLWNGPGRDGKALESVTLDEEGARLPGDARRAMLVGRAVTFEVAWIAVAQLPRRALVQLIWPQVWITLAWTLLALGVAAGLASFEVRRLTRPLERLAERISTLEPGDPSAGELAAADGAPRELEVVSGAVRELSLRLERTNAGLSRLLAEREETIQRRTAQLRASEARSRALIEESLAYVCTHTPDGVLRSVNLAAARAVGVEPGALVGRSLTEIVPPGVRDRVTAYLEEMARQGTHDGFLELRSATGSKLVWKYHNRRIGSGEEAIVIGVAVDVTEQRRAEAELARRADRDPLTGLGNRELLERRIAEARGRSRSGEERFALVYFDLDRFKPINDVQGHAAGDHVLVVVGERLRNRVRGADTVARVGGDEFVVLLAEVADRSQAELTAASLRERIGEPIPWGETELRVSASAGVAIRPDDGDTAEELLRVADAAMYRGKREGREEV